jgi:hypothetical protein
MSRSIVTRAVIHLHFSERRIKFHVDGEESTYNPAITISWWKTVSNGPVLGRIKIASPTKQNEIGNTRIMPRGLTKPLDD